MIINNCIPGYSEWLRLDERTASSRPRAPVRPGSARRSRDHFATDSVRSKLPPPLYVPVSPSPIPREASRDLWRSIGPSTMVVLKLRTSLSAHPLSANIMDDLIFMSTAKRPLYHRRITHRRDSGRDSDQLGRRKPAELSTSGQTS